MICGTYVIALRVVSRDGLMTIIGGTYYKYNFLPRQKTFVAKDVVATKLCCFVVTNTSLSRKKRFCRAKTFVATKIIFVAAPANDRCACVLVSEVVNGCIEVVRA